MDYKDYKKRWHIIEPLGEGGQGKVYRVLDTNEIKIDDLSQRIEKSIGALTGMKDQKSEKGNFESFRKAILDLIRIEDPINHGALKVLHESKDARDPERAEVRIKNEIEAMSKVSYPNLLRIIDHDPDGKWFVSQFHPKGTLNNNRHRFIGNFVSALKAFRPLVEGVSELHKNDVVHRDIKPQNVFLDSNDNLVLGDFGLVFFSDEQHTRISETFENVGSRDWMPAWAMSMRIEDVKPTFDVFSLGKLLWAMVSNKPLLCLWYFDRPEFNIEQMFPNAPYIKLANTLFKKCIVELEKDCLPNATALLMEVDQILSIIDKNADVIGPNVERPCKVCGRGMYIPTTDSIDAFGLNPKGGWSFKVFTCNYCGNVQLFSVGRNQNPPAWSD